jgi:perosamine synthetase
VKHSGNELEYIRRVLNSECWSATGGSWNNALEREFAELHGVKYAVAMNSGTATLHAALVAMGVGPGDEVISPALTVIMDSAAIIQAGATPVYADIDPHTFNISHHDVARKITDRTKAIIAVSLYGLPPDLFCLKQVAQRHGVRLIEDNAQCILSRYYGRMAGTIGDMASYSFETTKHLSCGEGGILITDDERLAEIARKVGGHGYRNLRAEEGRVRLNQDVFQNPAYKRHDLIGWNYRLSEFSAAIALAQLERVRELVDRRIRVAGMFLEVMRGCGYFTPQFVPDGVESSYYTLGVLYDGPVPWAEFRRRYVENGGDGIYAAWSLPYEEPALAGIPHDPCHVAESIQPRLMQFKTNYRDMAVAERKVEALEKTIGGLG